MRTFLMLVLPLALSAQIPNPFGGGGGGGGGGGLSNPMTTTQDIIVGASGGTPARLGVGSNGQCLIVNGSAQVVWGSCSGTSNQLFVANAQTATYQVVAADFSGCKTIPVASGTFTITLVASGTQPVSGQCITVLNYGSGTVTIARSGQNINGGTSSLTLPPGSATGPMSAWIVSDGTNYEAWLNTVPSAPASATVLGSNGNFQPIAATTTGSGTTVVLATSPALTTPNLGTPSAVNLSNATALPCAATPALTGDTTTSAGSCATTTAKINGTSFPTSATVVGSNGSAQPVAATLQGNGTKVQLSTGTTTTNDCVKFDANGNTVDAGAGCATGGAAAAHSVTFSATPTYTCTSASAGTVEDFTLSTALSANVTSSTLSTCTSGETLNFTYTQAAAGGPYTVVMPTNFDACAVSPTASAVTTCGYWYDGTNGHLVGITSNDTPSVLLLSATRAAPTVVPSGGAAWPDSTDNDLEYRQTGGGSIFKMFKSGVDANPVTGTVTAINNTAFPTSATVIGSNGSAQPIAATLQGNGTKVQLSTGTTTTNDCVKFDANGNTVDAGAACGSGGGGVTGFSAGTLSPLFTTSVATATTTPALSFSLTNAGAGTVFGNVSGSAGAPAYTTNPVLGIASSTAGSVTVEGTTNSAGFIIAQANANTITALGHAAANLATSTGVDTTAFGDSALAAETSGAENVGFGANAGVALTTGPDNTAIGDQSLGADISAAGNTAVGYHALNAATGPDNTCIGRGCLLNITVGASSTGSNNALGNFAGRYFGISTSNLTTATNSIFIGQFAAANANGDNDEIVIGSDNGTGTPGTPTTPAVGAGSNTAVIGNSALTDVWFGNSTTTATTSATTHQLAADIGLSATAGDVYTTIGITGGSFGGTAPASVSSSPGTVAPVPFTVTGIAGGATSNATGTGGAGSTPAISGGTGGAGTGTNAIGGAGGSITLSPGNGGASNGTGVNSNGGSVTVTPGVAGTGGSGTAGKQGVLGVAGTGAGFAYFTQGAAATTTNSNVPANSIIEQAPTSVTAYSITKPTAAPVNNFSSKTTTTAGVETYNKMPQTAMLTSQYTNSTTGFTNVTGGNSLAFTMDANTTYQGYCELFYQAASTGGLNIEFTGPASPTFVTYGLVDIGSATTIVNSSVATAYSTSLGAAVTTATTNFPAHVSFGISNGNSSGTLQLLAKSSAAVQLQIQTGSFCVMQ